MDEYYALEKLLEKTNKYQIKNIGVISPYKG